MKQHKKMNQHQCFCVFGCRFPVGSFAIQTVIKSATSQFSTQSHLIQVCFFILILHICTVAYLGACALVYWETLIDHRMHYVCCVKSDLCLSVVKVKGFFSSLKERGSQMRSVQEALETIRLNQRWMDKNLPTLKKWL